MTKPHRKKLWAILLVIAILIGTPLFAWMYRSDVHDSTFDPSLLRPLDFSKELTEGQKQYVATSLKNYYDLLGSVVEINTNDNQIMLSITIESSDKSLWQALFNSSNVRMQFYLYKTKDENPSAIFDNREDWNNKGVEYNQKIKRSSYNNNEYAIMPYIYDGIQMYCFRIPESFRYTEINGNYGCLRLDSTASTVSKDQGDEVLIDFIRQYEKIMQNMPKE